MEEYLGRVEHIYEEKGKRISILYDKFTNGNNFVIFKKVPFSERVIEVLQKEQSDCEQTYWNL